MAHFHRIIDMSSIVEVDAKGKRLAYKDMHTLYEAEQEKTERLSSSEAVKELSREENSEWLKGQLKRKLDPKDSDTTEV